jgi:GT2 family glycosyltransferase
MSDVEVTIAICSHNRTEGLRDCLESLVSQDTQNLFKYEIVVVHTGSSGTPELIDDFAKRFDLPIRGILQHHGGAVVARNVGIKAARGEWIALFDDDQVAEPQWLRELWLVATSKNAKSVGGLLHLRLPDGCERNFTYRCRRMLGETVKWDSVQLYTRQEGPGSGNQMIHREVFKQVGMYDQSFALRGYDTDMYRRIRLAGIESWFVPNAVGYHVIPADRLEDAFFKETSLHNGWSFARRDFLEHGAAYALLRTLLRSAQAILVNVPRLGLSLCIGDREKILEGRIRLWRAEGYVRSTLYKIAPVLFPQTSFFSRYEFRAEKRFPSLTVGMESPVP